MKRRDFITIIVGATFWPLRTSAQPTDRMRRVGVLMGSAQTKSTEALLGAFLRRLDELGWKNGSNIHTDVRWWDDNPEKVRAAVTELVSVSPDVIVAWTNLAVAALKPVAGNVPIVFVGVGDPVGSGFVDSLVQPGANITGFVSYEPAMGGKWLDVLKKAAPNLTSVLVLMHPETLVHQAFWKSIAAAAPGLGIDAKSAPIHDAGEIDRAISSFGSTKNGGLVVLPHAVTSTHNDMIVALESRADRGTGVAQCYSHMLCQSPANRGRWPDELWGQRHRHFSSSRQLCGTHPEG